MGTGSIRIPQCCSTVLIDGYSYQITLRIATGKRAEEFVPPHSHAQFELFAFPEGTVAMQVGNAPEIEIQGGECYLLRPHVYHRRSIGSNMQKYWSMFIRCPHDAPLWNLDSNFIRLKCADTLLKYFVALEQELTLRRIGTDSNIASLLGLLLVELLWEIDKQPWQQATHISDTLLRYDDVIDDYIALHYSENMRIDDLAQQVGISPRHLARIMQQRYGCTFRQKLLEIRMYYAKKFLTETELSISKIANACGFTAEEAFRAAFRRTVGCTPSQYRRQQ